MKSCFNRLPVWLRQEITGSLAKSYIKILSEEKIKTICAEAHCPNLPNCFKKRQMAFMILGSNCTRNCRFCAVEKASGVLPALDRDEPLRVARIISRLNLNYAVITSVTRDDLEDGGAAQFVKTVRSIRQSSPQVKIEILIPDFLANKKGLEEVVSVRPDVIGHNLETVQRLSRFLRPQADYSRSLKVLQMIKEIDSRIITKSSLILGLGEDREEVIQAMQDLRKVNCDILTLGQYLAPSVEHYPVKEFILPEKFEEFKNLALAEGFKAVLSAPKARSSFQAEQLIGGLSNA